MGNIAWWVIIFGKLVQWGESWTFLPDHMYSFHNNNGNHGDLRGPCQVYDRDRMKGILHGEWKWFSSTYQREHPDKDRAPFASFVSTIKDNFLVHIDASSDEDYLKGKVILHGGRIDGECPLSSLDDVKQWPTRDRPLRVLWKPIFLRQPPRSTGAQFSRIIQMLPVIYRLQVHGLEMNVIGVVQSTGQTFLSVTTSTRPTSETGDTKGRTYEFTLVKSSETSS
jgi:hypothetical protein